MRGSFGYMDKVLGEDGLKRLGFRWENANGWRIDFETAGNLPVTVYIKRTPLTVEDFWKRVGNGIDDAMDLHP